MRTWTTLVSFLVGVGLLGLLPVSAAGHGWSQADIETLVRREILSHEHHRRWFAFCSDINERIIQRAEQCIERREVGLPTTCQVTDLLKHGAALRTIPVCAGFAAIAERCEEKYGPDKKGTLVKDQTFFACLKHPPVEWLEEVK